VQVHTPNNLIGCVKTPFYARKTRDVKNTGTPLYVCLINYLKEVNML